MTFDRPQRIAPSAAPGALLKRFDAPQRAQNTDLDDDAYLAPIRQLPCLKCGLDPCAVAAHVRMNSAAFNKTQAMAKKPPARFTVPLCSACHTNDPDSQHRLGEVAFWNGLGLNPLLVAEKLYSRRGDLVAMRAVVFTAIAERSASLPDMPPNTDGGSCPQS